MIYLDLDGVFADFEKKFQQVCGFKYHENPQLAWSMLDKIDNLFYTLEPLEGAKQMFDIIMDSGEEVKILTALPLPSGKLVTASDDKKRWVAEFLDPNIEVICATNWRHKKKYCTPGDILVDDMHRNVLEWSQVGGIGIVHTSTDSTLSTLRRLGVI